MSAAAVSTLLSGHSSLLQRQRDRLQSERVASNDEEIDADEEEGSFINNGDANSIHEENENDDVENQGVSHFHVRPTLTLSELEESREMARRRSSACVLFALFVLFRLWITALQKTDIALLLVCLVGTSWTIRWIRYSRDQEAELDRRIAQHLANSENGTEMGREDLRMLSFQAQLALAIMESQRQMMMGGRPEHEEQDAGVGESAKKKWDCFCYKEMRDKKDSKNYGALTKQNENDEEPHCSICLGEYEEGEELCRLPCSHIYHADCINSWCSNHTRCPLCNVDLEEEAQGEVEV